MSRPPRPRNEPLLSWGLIVRAYLFLGMLEAAAAMAAFSFVLHAAGWHYGEALAKSDPIYLQATTACLAAIVVTQIINVFLCRHPLKSSLSFGLFSNPMILIGIAVNWCSYWASCTPGRQLGIWHAPIDAEVWLFMVPFAALMWALEEARKACCNADRYRET
jgi:magnesium-transporting ATPase (P-type)